MLPPPLPNTPTEPLTGENTASPPPVRGLNRMIRDVPQLPEVCSHTSSDDIKTVLTHAEAALDAHMTALRRRPIQLDEELATRMEHIEQLLLLRNEYYLRLGSRPFPSTDTAGRGARLRIILPPPDTSVQHLQALAAERHAHLRIFTNLTSEPAVRQAPEAIRMWILRRRMELHTQLDWWERFGIRAQETTEQFYMRIGELPAPRPLPFARAQALGAVLRMEDLLGGSTDRLHAAIARRAASLHHVEGIATRPQETTNHPTTPANLVGVLRPSLQNLNLQLDIINDMYTRLGGTPMSREAGRPTLPPLGTRSGFERETFEQLATTLQAEIADEHRILMAVRTGRILHNSTVGTQILDHMITRLEAEGSWITRKLERLTPTVAIPTRFILSPPRSPAAASEGAPAPATRPRIPSRSRSPG